MQRTEKSSLGLMGQVSQGEQPPAQRRALALGLLGFGLGLVALGFLLQPVGELFRGWGRILVSPSVLISDGKAVGGVGAAFANAGVMTLLSLALLMALKAEITGTALAAVMIVCGFSFFGKNPLNALPLVAGVLAYSRLTGAPLQGAAVPALFSTAMGPLFSAVAFGLDLPLPASLPLALALSLLGGFLLVPIARRTLPFHQGHCLYNSGFAAGLTAMLIVNVLRVFGLSISSASQVHAGGGAPMALGFGLFFLGLTALGWWLNGRSLSGYGALLREPGKLGPESDFVKRYGLALSLVNMGLSSLLALAFALIMGAPMNGPVLGAILTITGFAAFGKHPLNILPVMAGALLMTWLSVHSLQATGTVVVVMFSTTLAPMAGSFGPLAGLAAGMLHVAVAHNSGVLHAGVNLYNNGFAGGLVAGLMTAVLEPLMGLRRKAAASGEVYRDA